MYKTLLICALIFATMAGNVRKPHKGVSAAQKRIFNSAFFEVQNIGEQDYHLSEKVSKHWELINKEVNKKSNKKDASRFVEVAETYQPSVIGKVTDLSQNVGVVSYTVTDINGNILEQDAGDHLAAQLNSAYLEMTSQIQVPSDLNIDINIQDQ